MVTLTIIDLYYNSEMTMRKSLAKKLHNGDQVTVNDSHEIATIIAYPRSVTIDKKEYILLELFGLSGYQQVTHLDVK